MRPFYLVQIFLGLTLTGVLTLTSCKNDEPIQPHAPTIQLSVEDVSCTEAWLKISLTDSNQPRTIAILQDGQRVSVSRLLSPDSVFVIEGLLPRRTYSFVAQRLRDSTAIDASSAVQATTMDTTSHNFTWRIDTLGVTASSLSDIAIINDTLAYAVGEMYLRDSTGQIDPNAYNLAKWDGQQWQLLRIQFYTFCGQPSTGSYPTKSIFAFGPTDVWIGMNGSQVVRWNGQSQAAPVCIPVSINKMWGENPNSVYAVGNNGGIAHYNGSTWQRVESGTTIDISDVFGALNTKTNALDVIAAAGNPFVGPARKILKLVGTTASALSDSGITRAISGVWFSSGKRYWVVGDGIWYSNYSPNGFNWQNRSGTWTQFALTKVRGNDVNDVFTVGSFSEVLHFNGSTIRSYRGATGMDGLYWGVATRGDQIMAVGQVPPRAVVLRGRRVP
jgi:hypothetical protein